MELSEIVAGRRSVKSYDPNHTISDGELKALFEKVILSPSSFNLQHWRFVVVRDPERKKQLREVSYNQEQVETASAVIIVAGKLNAHEDGPEIYKNAPEEVKQAMLPLMGGFYADNPQMQRDEVIRSCTLASMTLMVAAYDMGYATGPMIGFDPDAVSKLVGLDERHVPVMMIVLGKQTGDMRPRAFRYPPNKVVRLESFDGPGLG